MPGENIPFCTVKNWAYFLTNVGGWSMFGRHGLSFERKVLMTLARCFCTSMISPVLESTVCSERTLDFGSINVRVVIHY